MQTANNHLDKCIEEIEAKLGWGSGTQWTHQDFISLSEKIQEETGESLSYITLKRLWGKVSYNSLPNSVVFNIDAKKAPYDSVVVQQSWDTRLRTTIPKGQSQHTSIYYFPGYFDAKLVVGEEVVQEHSVHITTDGWYCAVQQEAVPVYFSIKEAQQEGQLELRPDQLRARNISLQPRPPITRMGNCRDFDGLMTDNFIFEAKVRNTYKEGSAVCQNTRIYLLCQGTAIWIPLTAKGCISSASLNFVNHYASGKKKDLSAFGVDFDKDIQVKMQCINGKASIFLDGKLVYSIAEKIQPAAIKGIDFRFEGLGAIDEVKLGRPGGEWVFRDSFSVDNQGLSLNSD